jgi:FixJ family two-component response regulator
MTTQFLVHIVDDDDAVRDALTEVLDALEMSARGFASANDFLDYVTPNTAGCLVLDIRMPGISGLELQKKLRQMGSTLPIIFITGHADVPMAVEAIKLGAIEFIQKPFREQELLDAINIAMEQAKSTYGQALETKELRKRLDTLSVREREVLKHIANGDANKIIAHELGISQRTVENHRASILDKMQVKSTAGLITAFVTAGR